MNKFNNIIGEITSLKLDIIDIIEDNKLNDDQKYWLNNSLHALERAKLLVNNAKENKPSHMMK